MDGSVVLSTTILFSNILLLNGLQYFDAPSTAYNNGARSQYSHGYESSNEEFEKTSSNTDKYIEHSRASEVDDLNRMLGYEKIKVAPKIKYQTVIEKKTIPSVAYEHEAFFSSRRKPDKVDSIRDIYPTGSSFKSSYKENKLSSYYDDLPHYDKSYDKISIPEIKLDDFGAPYKIRNSPKFPKLGNKVFDLKFNNDVYSKIIEMDLLQNFKHLNYQPGTMSDQNARYKPPKSYNFEDQYSDGSQVDLQKLVSPFSINGKFKMPKLIETSFQPSMTASYKYEAAANPDLYDITPTRNIRSFYSKDQNQDIRNKPHNEIQYPDKLFHYSSYDNDAELTFPHKKKYGAHTKIINPNFEYTAYLPPAEYSMGNLNDDSEPPHYTVNYKTIHIPHRNHYYDTDKFNRYDSHGRRQVRSKHQKSTHDQWNYEDEHSN